MKFTVAIFLHAASLATALSRADVSEAEAEAICGDLGVMSVPEGVDPHHVRLCLEHPTFTMEKEKDLTLEKRKCWHDKHDVGCSHTGWCYRNCDNGGSGAWCWTTVGGPHDSWKSCKRDSDCSRTDSCGEGGCEQCGCGC